MRHPLLGLILAALVNPVNYGERPVQEQKRVLYQVRETLPKVERGKTTASFNTISQKSRRRRAKWSNKK